MSIEKAASDKWRVVREVSVSVDALIVARHSRQDPYFMKETRSM